MVHVWVYTLVSVMLVSLVSFVGIFTLSLNKKYMSRILLFLISFSAGALLGDAFFHLLPESLEMTDMNGVAIFILLGMLIFFVLEKFIHWRHCHMPTSEKHPHPLAFMNLIGDGFHNFMDGIIIAGSFLVSYTAGIATSIAVLLHEIPQEIGDLGVLLHAGMSRKKVLLYNFLSALTAVLGAIIVLIVGSQFTQITQFILPVTIGGFIYIAGADLIPELHKETQISKSVIQLIGLVAGMTVMLLLLFLE